MHDYGYDAVYRLLSATNDQEDFNYDFIINQLNSLKLKKDLDRIIYISRGLFEGEHIPHEHLDKIISKHKLTIDGKIFTELEYYKSAFKEALQRQNLQNTKEKEESIKIRSKLNLNQALNKIFSPGKIRILEKIFSHEKLTNSELKYYYRGIKPIISSISNENLHNYLRIIESIKKLT